jgi:hypothetical protein
MRHMQLLSPTEQQAFTDGRSISPDDLLAEIRRRDVQHAEGSRPRKCLAHVQGFFQAVEGYFKPVAVMVGYGPDFSSLAVGGVYLVVQVRWLCLGITVHSAVANGAPNCRGYHSSG